MTSPKFLASVAAFALVTTLGIRTASAGECHDQPNMAKAMHSLERAREDLARAEHNKGGWRERALKHVDAALRETHTGCEVANGRR
jgi:hypothetical protein